MNFSLEIAERQLGSTVAVFWVEAAVPSMFSLSGFSEPVVVFNPRLVELWADVRSALTTSFYEDSLKVEVIERLCLQFIAERSLWKHIDPEFSILAILNASAIHPGLVHNRNTLMSMEYEPITPVYMSCWFYALFHEVGHFVKPTKIPYSDEDLNSITLGVLSDFNNLPEDIKRQAIEGIGAHKNRSILSPNSLRDEGIADIFATSVLLESTHLIMHEIGNDEHRFDLFSFISEMFISLNIIATMSRCERVCALASSSAGPKDAVVDLLLHPVAVSVRALMIRHYLERATLAFLHGDKWTDLDREKVSLLIDEINEGLKPKIEAMEKGMASAIRFALNRTQRPDYFAMLASWEKTKRNPQVVQEFLDLARSLGRWSTYFEGVQAKLNDPSAELKFSLDSPADFYHCPFVEDPEGFRQPFSLPTRHGNVVFVFASNSLLFEHFCEAFSKDMAKGWRIVNAVLLVNGPEDLQKAVAMRVPLSMSVKVVVEGTEIFDQYIMELEEGAIWSDSSPSI